MNGCYVRYELCSYITCTWHFKIIDHCTSACALCFSAIKCHTSLMPVIYIIIYVCPASLAYFRYCTYMYLVIALWWNQSLHCHCKWKLLCFWVYVHVCSCEASSDKNYWQNVTKLIDTGFICINSVYLRYALIVRMYVLIMNEVFLSCIFV